MSLDCCYNKIMQTSLATFGMGCFWCSEAIFQRLSGVSKITSGYMGGTTKNPTYEDVCEGTTGHAEVIQVEYDPTKITYPKLLEIFWKMHNPTTLNQQGADHGTQYRSVIFYHDEAQKKSAIKSKIEAQKKYDDPIVTEILPATPFYPAESYHQDYFEKNTEAPYCQHVIAPKLAKMKSEIQNGK